MKPSERGNLPRVYGFLITHILSTAYYCAVNHPNGSSHPVLPINYFWVRLTNVSITLRLIIYRFRPVLMGTEIQDDLGNFRLWPFLTRFGLYVGLRAHKKHIQFRKYYPQIPIGIRDERLGRSQTKLPLSRNCFRQKRVPKVLSPDINPLSNYFVAGLIFCDYYC